MATTAPSRVSAGKPSASPKPRGDGTQRRLFRSISRFLSGAKSRPKLAGARASPSAASNPASPLARSDDDDDDDDDGVQLRDVRANSMSTRSHRAPSASTSASGGRDLDLGDAASQVSGADTDASVRPISPTSLAPSSIASHSHTNSTSNASYAPTHRTFKSYASTKPTTLLSIDSGAGANRIAVVPGTGTVGSGQQQLPTSHSGGSLSPPGSAITFSAIPSSPPPSSPTTAPSPTSLSPSSSGINGMQVPRHTLAHPRNNPHPASPPPDNASMLTLASSSFAPSIFLSRNSGAPSGTYALSGLRTSTRIEADEDASVRALAPSRRASDESIGSRSTWSAAVLGGAGNGTASLRTVGTGGTGGDILSSPGGGELSSAETGLTGGETEAQRVVRKEGEETGTSLRVDHPADSATAPTLGAVVVPPTPEPDLIAADAAESEKTPPAVGSPSDGSASPLSGSTSHPTSPREENFSETLATPLVSANGGAMFGSLADLDTEDGATPRKRADKDAQSIVSTTTGYETDAASFVDAQSNVGDVEDQ